MLAAANAVAAEDAAAVVVAAAAAGSKWRSASKRPRSTLISNRLKEGASRKFQSAFLIWNEMRVCLISPAVCCSNR